jgi:hypothetical protein
MALFYQLLQFCQFDVGLDEVLTWHYVSMLK